MTKQNRAAYDSFAFAACLIFDSYSRGKIWEAGYHGASRDRLTQIRLRSVNHSMGRSLRHHRGLLHPFRLSSARAGSSPAALRSFPSFRASVTSEPNNDDAGSQPGRSCHSGPGAPLAANFRCRLAVVATGPQVTWALSLGHRPPPLPSSRSSRPSPLPRGRHGPLQPRAQGPWSAGKATAPNPARLDSRPHGPRPWTGMGATPPCLTPGFGKH